MILNNLSGRHYAPRGKKISRLILLMSSQNKLEKTTLGGCVFEKIHKLLELVKNKRIRSNYRKNRYLLNLK